jgi:hypothetical protein
MEELGAADDSLGRSVHSVDVGGLVELDMIVARMLILEGKFLPGLGHER